MRCPARSGALIRHKRMPVRTLCCLLTLLLPAAGIAHATARHIPIHPGVVLHPGATLTAQVTSAKPVEIGGAAV